MEEKLHKEEKKWKQGKLFLILLESYILSRINSVYRDSCSDCESHLNQENTEKVHNTGGSAATSCEVTGRGDNFIF